ncbi:hypothetical protein DM02DRAFT_660055 [Periconia macrospinosa]|uniref:Uncharacterized protein n=1 Tax=Periconia macrospinosa TaxID=97972 RepID=A0A2V1DEF1_9PLEO|nr:hypothetical protein DM02DRAFT_660055 [Periconia macrospinosa]
MSDCFNKVINSLQSYATILQVALIELLCSFNVQLAAVDGHSSEEIAATQRYKIYSFCAGAPSRESAWKIAYYRGIGASMLAKTSGVKGTMMNIGISKHNVQSSFNQIISMLGKCRQTVACVNSTTSVTMSGE